MRSSIMPIWRIEIVDQSLDIIAIRMENVDRLEARIVISFLLDIIHAYD